MKSNLAKAQDVFLDKINLICSRFGLNNIMAQLYALLYLSNKPMSLNDMVEQLKISKGSASINIRALERYGAVKRIWVRGSRKDYYAAESDISKVVLERIRSMAQGRLSEVYDMIYSSTDVLNSVIPKDEEEKERVAVFKQRLEALKNIYDQAKSMFDLFNVTLLSKDIKGNGQEVGVK